MHLNFLCWYLASGWSGELEGGSGADGVNGETGISGADGDNGERGESTCRERHSLATVFTNSFINFRVLEKRIRCQVSIDNMQFGFMPGKGTTDAIFIM